MDFTAVIAAEQLPLLAFAIPTLIGIVNIIKTTFPRIAGLYSMLLSITIGLLAGYTGLFGLTVPLGLLAAFAASGVYKVAEKSGGN